MKISEMEEKLREAGWSECELRSAEGAAKGIGWAKFPEADADVVWVDWYTVENAYRAMNGEAVEHIARCGLRKVRVN